MEDVETLTYDPENPGGKILVGRLGQKLIGIDDPRHVVTVAGSRSGKSVGLIGNLMFYPGSIIATDPKGELAMRTARRRAEDLGQHVHVLDPFGVTGPELFRYRAAYNPMSVLTLDNPRFLEDAALIAEALVVQSGNEHEPHWNESAKNFIEGVIVHVATYKDFKDKRNLVEVRTMIVAALLLLKGAKYSPDLSPEDFPFFRQMILNGQELSKDKTTEDIGTSLMGAAIDFFYKSDRERSSVHSTALRHTKFLDYSAFKDVLRTNNFDLRDLKRNPNGVSIYLCFPAMRIETSRRWLRIFINQLLDAMQEEKTPPPRANVLVCLDEFPILGHMTQLETAVGLVAGFGMKLWVILQDWGQGKALYGTRWETFVGNAGILQFFGNNDVMTAEYLSNRLGKVPIHKPQAQDEKALFGGASQTEYQSLMTPPEAMRFFGIKDPQKRQAVIWAGLPPMLLQKVEYFDKQGPLAKYQKED